MASAAEQLAATINFGAIGKATELRKRILFTLGCLIVYRLGTFLPLPGVDRRADWAILQGPSGGILGLLNMFAGGAVGRMSIFALSIMPYISASIIVQLMSGISPSLEALEEGGRGRPEEAEPIYALSDRVPRGIPVLRRSRAAWRASGVVLSDPFWFHISTIVILTAGTMFLMWLGEQITARGIGNGISLIIFSGIVANLPISAGAYAEHGRHRLPRYDLDHRHHHHGRCRHHHDRLLRARAAPPPGAVSEASGRHEDVRRRELAPAAEAQQLRRHSADLRQFAAAAAADRRRFQRTDRSGLAADDLAVPLPRQAALHAALCRPDHLLRVLLHGGGVQSGGDRRQSEEVRRLHSGHTGPASTPPTISTTC